MCFCYWAINQACQVSYSSEMPVFKRAKSPSSSSNASGSSSQVSDSHDQVDSPLFSVKSSRQRAGSKKEPERPVEKEEKDNFFDFNPDECDVWDEQNLVRNLRQSVKKKMRVRPGPAGEAQPLNVGDGEVETIGPSFVGAEQEVQPPVPTEPTGHGRAHSFNLPPSPPSTLVSQRTRAETVLGVPSSLMVPSKESFGSLDKVAELEREIKKLKANRWRPPPIPDVIDRLLLGQSCSLDWYKSLEEKRALLDAAIATNDGNCIMAVLLYIRRTIDHTLLMGMLIRRPVATRHYCSFLRQLQAWKELTTLYRVLGDYVTLGYLKLVQCESEDSVQSRIDLVKSCHIMFKNSPDLQENAGYVEEYGKLLEKQMRIEESIGRGGSVIHSILFHPLTTTLLYCCRKHWNEPETRTGSPEALKKQFHISDKQYFQMSLLALALNKKWAEVDLLLTSKGVLGMGKKRKSPIGFERVVKTLSKRAPDEVLTKYLNEVEDLESRLQLATETQVFTVGLETLKTLKDRDRLAGYINLIPPKLHYKYRPQIAAILNNSQIRWK